MNKFLSRTVAVVSVACTLLSVAGSWFAIPVDGGPERLTIAEPWITPYYRGAALLVAIIVLVAWWKGRPAASLTLAPIAVGLWLAALLIYPYCVMIWDPAISGEAARLEAEHRSLIWWGGDINTSLECRSVGALDKLYLTDPPHEINAMLMHEWQPSEWTLGRLPSMIDRLGYSTSYFEFIRWGWVSALAGGVLLLIWRSAPLGRLEARQSGRALATLVGAVGVASLLAWGWSFWAATKLASAAEHTAQGEYRDARNDLQSAADLLPVLRESTHFIIQTGLVEESLGEDTPAARLYRADVLAHSGRFQRADVIYEGLLIDSGAEHAVRREACRALVRAAVDALNAGRTNEATRRFEFILAAEPCNLKANYALQLACLRTGQYQELFALVERMDSIYGYFQFPNKQAVQFAAHATAGSAHYALGDPASAAVELREVLDR